MKFIKKFFSKPTDIELRAGDRTLDPDNLKAAVGEALIADLIRERQSERNWRHIKRIVVSGSAVVLFAIYVGFYVTSLGYHVVPNSDIVGVVHITGAIEEGSQTG